jgi:hypothetical protein
VFAIKHPEFGDVLKKGIFLSDVRCLLLTAGVQIPA